eukprot:gi/632934982/ref/XP_007887263.1/ PREDICTED: zinc finger matrin-type protein 3 isoform X3 [Callorhinchus milii]
MAMNVRRGAGYFPNNHRRRSPTLPADKGSDLPAQRFGAPDMKTKTDCGIPVCQQPYRHTALSQPLQPMTIQAAPSKQLQPTSPAVLPSSSSPLPPEQKYKSSQSEHVPVQQEIAPSCEVDRDPVLADLCRPLLCKLCNVSLNSAQQAQAHYQPGSSKIAGRVILATANDYCKLCDASFSSPAVAQAHYHGKNHAKRLRLAEAQKSSSLTETTDLAKRRPRKEGSEFKNVPNRRNLHGAQNTQGPYFNPRPRQRIPRDLAMCVTPSGQFYCSMCNVGASEEQEFRQHLESKLHKSKVSEQRYRSEMENLGYA